MIYEQWKLPAWQQAVVDKCYHPTGVWEPFPEHDLELAVPARFESIAARYPHRLAVVDQDQALTYAQLNAAANRVAHGLLARLGPGPEPVIHLTKHAGQGVVALLGILKAGKFYVPLAAAWPLEQLRTILSLMEARLLLSDAPNRELASAVAAGLIDTVTLDEFAADANHNPDSSVGPDNYHYVVFTSGSTGVPKGVIDIHRTAVRVAARAINTYHVCPQDRILLTNRLSFSGSLNAMYETLLAGAGLYLYDVQEKGIETLPQWIAQQGLTILNFTPQVFRLLVEAVERPRGRPNVFTSVRALRMGTDRILPIDLEAYRRLTPDSTIFRAGFGASETKLPLLILYDKASAAGVQEVPVGWPPSDLDVRIVDEAGNRLPPGARGEIVIHSRVMARGYWNQPELTRQKFRPDPEKPGWYSYYTGDLGRVADDGCVYHLGRIDSQVKVRGLWVEMSEVERAILALDNVEDAAVALRGKMETDQYLVAWLIWKDPARALSPIELRRVLAHRLPTYMVPAHFVVVEHLPLNANGKVNRQALPDPDIRRDRTHLDVAFAPPQTPLEKELARIWAEVLQMAEIGRHDDFFDLGGDSIQAMQIFSRLQEGYGAPIFIQAIFDAPTVAQMAIYLTAHYTEENQIDENQVPQQFSLRNATTVETNNLDQDTHLAFHLPGHRSKDIDSALIARFRLLVDERSKEQIIEQTTGQTNARVQPHAPPLKNPPALFILAPPRSGTTLLRVMLAGHPQLFAPPELHLLSYTTLAQRKAANEGRKQSRLEGSVRALMALHDCSAATALQKMARYENENLSTQAFYAILQAAAGERLLVDKTPAYTSHVAILRHAEAWFDAPRYIHLSRHPYGMIHSFVMGRFHLLQEFNQEFSPQQLAELTWLILHKNIDSFLDQAPRDRYLHLQYEDLVTEPEAAMRRICNWLEIEFHKAMLNPYVDAESHMTDGIHAESRMLGDPNFHQHTQIQADRAQSWRQALTSKFLSSQSIELAHRLGYTDIETDI